VTCSAPNCPNPSRAKGLCIIHYMRMRAKGRLDRVTQPTAGLTCKEEGCSAPVRAKGWCYNCYQKFYMRQHRLVLNLRRERRTSALAG
jgi:hypothetical protein